jgi:hypothetical protein
MGIAPGLTVPAGIVTAGLTLLLNLAGHLLGSLAQLAQGFALLAKGTFTLLLPE